MSVWLTGVVAVIYTATAVHLAVERKWGLVVMFAAYALANVGLMMEMRR